MSKNLKVTANPRGLKTRQRRAAGVADAASMGESDTLQQRLVDAQATIARDYTRLLELEARHRHLFDSAEPILIVEATGLGVVDANAAAGTLLGVEPARLAGSLLSALFNAEAVEAIRRLRAAVLRGGRADPARIAASGQRPRLSVSGRPFRQDGNVVLLLRLETGDARSTRGERDASTERDAHARARRELASYASGAPDGVVLTDPSGRILQANSAFVELVQLATESQVRGESLGRWLGRTSVDLGVLLTNLRQRGTLKLFSTSLRGEYGTVTEVEISAAQVTADDSAVLGFTIRDVARRLAGDTHVRDDLSKSVGKLTELVGRVPLREIVGNTSDLIERMCIEAALQLTRDNRAAAAELLGLSRQSLYVKLRRYDMGDLGSAEVVEEADSP